MCIWEPKKYIEAFYVLKFASFLLLSLPLSFVIVEAVSIWVGFVNFTFNSTLLKFILYFNSTIYHPLPDTVFKVFIGLPVPLVL